jgi:uncharacterized protein YjeT (DUF2065 family)
VVLGIVFLVAGLVAVTPAGARWSARKHQRDGAQGQGYAPTSVGANRILGLVLIAAGLAVVVTSLT